MDGDHTGAKVAILSGGRLVTLLRDDLPGLAYANMWDLPGGGREAGESAFDTARRETWEETGLWLDPARVVHRRRYGTSAFFGAVWAGLTQGDLRLGDEGQALRLMPVAEFLSRTDAIDSLQARVADWLGAGPYSAASESPGRP